MRILWATAGMLVLLNMGVGFISAVIPSELSRSRHAWDVARRPASKALSTEVRQIRCPLCQMPHGPGECPQTE